MVTYVCGAGAVFVVAVGMIGACRLVGKYHVAGQEGDDIADNECWLIEGDGPVIAGAAKLVVGHGKTLAVVAGDGW